MKANQIRMLARALAKKLKWNNNFQILAQKNNKPPLLNAVLVLIKKNKKMQDTMNIKLEKLSIKNIKYSCFYIFFVFKCN